MSIPSREQIQKTLERARRDPVWWSESIFKIGLWEKQRAILESVRDNRETNVASCHSAGKSFIGAVAVMWFLYCWPKSQVITTAPTARQVEGILWKEIHKLHGRASKFGHPLGGELTTRKLEINKEWVAIGFTAPDYGPDKFQGFHARHILVLADEACGISAEVFVGIESVLSSAGVRQLNLGNPTDPLSHFAKLFNGQPNCFHISAFDTPNFTTFGLTHDDFWDPKTFKAKDEWKKKIEGKDLPAPWLVTPEWVANRVVRWKPDNPLFVARVIGQFPKDAENALIPLTWIERAQEKQIPIDESEPIYLGLDVARGGGDETACYGRQGGVVRQVFVSSHEKTVATTGRALNAVKITEAKRINTDVIGVGAGVHDNLYAALGEVAQPINFGAAAVDKDRFANLKAELYWLERERYERNAMDIDPNDEELAAQAASIRYTIDGKGRIEIEKKEETKRRSGTSPDRFEAAVYSGAPEQDAPSIDVL